MKTSPDLRLQRLLGGPELEALRQRLRRRFELADAEQSLSSVHLSNLAPVEYSALCQLTGRPSRIARSMTLDIADLDARLRDAGLASSLQDALEQLDGSIVAKASLRKALSAQWSALTTSASAEGSPLLRVWLQNTATSMPLLKRLGCDPAGANQLLAATDTVLRRLPEQGLPRSQLAAETLGDAHALDPGRPIATLVLSAWRLHERMGPQEDEAPVETGGGAEERVREVWSRAGVLVNELARPALFLNLPVVPDKPCTWLPGEPAYLSLRQLVRKPYSWQVEGRNVYVCENPNIVAIVADRLGADSAPLVCTDGMPAAAQRMLLNQLVAAGAQLHYHGDYDWAGISIGNYVMRTWQAIPWRFTCRDYLEAVIVAPTRPRDLDIFGVEALWDTDLSAAMDNQGLAIPEEAIVNTLLGDLSH
ncbi:MULTISPECIES: TIGR02679 family protein [unclassified Pseudomonas]|uniref:TIGR02679 family protein n=1 Tax=unclassified Pseudomonas TaxID=196821 RepID=UPI00244C63C0|nr:MULTISPECIES: TIGR02679 family protein [unclassified Pseudomonas]MDG9924457.1 TIGR02679 family protein [Pseudomonas sp. GD04045]MDH0035203.1 TIGR02679 family protein [Pseudomonas sp. GD04019]